MADTLESLEIQVKHSATGAADEINKVAASVKVLGQYLTSVVPKLKEFSSALSGNSFTINDQSTNQYADTINNVKQAASGAKKATTEASKGISEMAKSASKADKPLGNFIASLKRIAFYRIIRGIIKSITQAFQEGLEKAYLFSQGMTGEGARFAAAMDRIKASGNQMKAQLGAAFISLLTAIEPILIQIINLVTAVADAITQLLSAFTGTTYLKANNTAAKFADTMARGGAAAKEWKNQPIHQKERILYNKKVKNAPVFKNMTNFAPNSVVWIIAFCRSKAALKKRDAAAGAVSKLLSLQNMV